MLMHELPHCLLTFTSSLSTACFYFQKPFSTVYYIAVNLLGRLVFVSKNIFLVILLILTFVLPRIFVITVEAEEL